MIKSPLFESRSLSTDRISPSPLPVPGLKGIAGPLEQVALHHHAVRSIHVELHLGVVIREVLKGDENAQSWSADQLVVCRKLL